VCHKFYRIENYFISEQVPYTKKFELTDKELCIFYPPKNCPKRLKIWVGDPGTGKKPIPDPESRGKKGKTSRFRKTAYCIMREGCCNFLENPDPDLVKGF
jgi:hypothetical protein